MDISDKAVVDQLEFFIIPACFFIILIMVVFFIGGWMTNRAPKSYGRGIFKHYQLATAIMNQSERTMYYELQRKFGREYLVCPKVRIEDAIVVKTSKREYKKRMALRGRISSRHFDALLTTKAGKPVAAFEFDGPTHFVKGSKYKDNFWHSLWVRFLNSGSLRATKGADKFKNQLCAAVGLPMFRISYQAGIREQIDRIHLP